MGSRAQVHIEDTGVWLYTHWGGRNLPQTVADALDREERWRDAEYIARMIFDQMTGDDESTTGFGIGTEQHGDVDRVVHVNCKVNGIRLQTDREVREMTFDTFTSEAVDASWPE